MSKGKKIPVYDICSLIEQGGASEDILIERFSAYLRRHYDHLHFPHGHSFFHLVFFTKGAGVHAIDFTKFDVKPFQMYFMVPGQVHSWHFEGKTDGYIINFSDRFFKGFLFDERYLERFSFFNGVGEDGVRQLPVKVHKQVIGLFEAMLSIGEGGVGVMPEGGRAAGADPGASGAGG